MSNEGETPKLQKEMEALLKQRKPQSQELLTLSWRFSAYLRPEPV